MPALLFAASTTFSSKAVAADYSARIHRAHYHAYYRYWPVHAPSELVAGVRGASPLTVPFFGYDWLPGPVHYYGPSPELCCLSASEPVVSVKY
jgi:hypothetical protein